MATHSSQPRRMRLAPLLLTLGLAVTTGVAAGAVSLAHRSPGRVLASPTTELGPLNPSPLPQPPAVFSVEAPPADRSLVWFAPAWEQVRTTMRLHAVDWSGHEVGRIEIPCQQPCSNQPSADGKRLLLHSASAPVPDGVFDETGRLVGSVDAIGAVWADDSRHLCVLRDLDKGAVPPPSTSRAELRLISLTPVPVKTVAVLAVATSPGIDTLWALEACGITNDRSVLSFSARSTGFSLRVIQLSTGKLLYARDEPSEAQGCDCAIRIVTNPGAGIAVEELSNGHARLRDVATGVTQPWRWGSSSGSVPISLSWNGRRVVTETAVVDIATGRVIWRPASGDSVFLIRAKPESEAMLLVTARKDLQNARAFILDGNGTALALPTSLADVAPGGLP